MSAEAATRLDRSCGRSPEARPLNRARWRAAGLCSRARPRATGARVPGPELRDRAIYILTDLATKSGGLGARRSIVTRVNRLAGTELSLLSDELPNR